MEYRYTLTDTREGYNDTNVIPKTTRLKVRNNIIIDADERIKGYCKNKNIDIFLTQCYVWGNRFDVTIELVGISEVVKLFKSIEGMFNNTKYLQLWTGQGMTYFPYTTEKEKQQILEDTKDLFVPTKNHRETIPLIAKPKVKKQPVQQFVLTL